MTASKKCRMCCILAICLICGLTLASARTDSLAQGVQFLEWQGKEVECLIGQVCVKLDELTQAGEARSLIESVGGEMIFNFDAWGWGVARFQSADFYSIAESLMQSGIVEKAIPHEVAHY